MFGVTVITEEPVNPPLCVVAVTVAEPTVTPVTTPEVLTVAIPGLLETQVTVLFVAFAGATVAVSVAVPPTVTVAVGGVTLTPVTGTLMGVTVTTEEEVKPPLCVVAVTVAEPKATPVTTPDELTVTIAGLLEAHVTVLFVAFAGATVAVKVAVAFKPILTVGGVTVTPVVGILLPGVTMTEEEAVKPPTCVVAVIVLEPTATPVTTPEALTVAATGLLEVQVTVVFVAFEGLTVAVNVVVVPTAIVAEAGATVTPVGGIVITVLPKNRPNSALAKAISACAQKR